MKLRTTATILSALVLFASATQSDASTDGKTRSFVYTNNTSSAWAWVTAYGAQQSFQDSFTRAIITSYNAAVTATEISGPLPTDTIVGAWCVFPGNFDKHGLIAAIHSVKVELSLTTCVNRPKTVYTKNVVFLGVDLPGHPQTQALPGITTITGGDHQVGTVQTHSGPGGSSEGNAPGGPALVMEHTPFAVTPSRGTGQ